MENNKPENPAAFPGIEGEDGYRNSFRVPNGEFINTQPGMTLRDYFAASVMQGFCSQPYAPSGLADDFHLRASQKAYEIADTMLAERNKE